MYGNIYRGNDCARYLLTRRWVNLIRTLGEERQGRNGIQSKQILVLENNNTKTKTETAITGPVPCRMAGGLNKYKIQDNTLLHKDKDLDTSQVSFYKSVPDDKHSNTQYVKQEYK